MNIFEENLNKITDLVQKNKKLLNIKETIKFNGVVVELPPTNFDFDLSSNIALVLAKINKTNPVKLAENIKDLILKKSNYYSEIEIAGPGFLNFNLNNENLIKIIKKILKVGKEYGKNNSNLNYNIEFVSANPTGPMHVGHCRGAIYGDVLSNLLKFNGNKVTKEYYVNDYGNQINNFVKSVFLRIKEIKFNEKFKPDKDLYPGQYVIDIANKIINEHKKEEFLNFEKSFLLLKKESLNHSMNLIKKDLKNLGIEHDNFFSETKMVEQNLVSLASKTLKDKGYVVEGYLSPPKGEQDTNWKKIKRLIFKSTLFGDDSDRAMQKNDSSWTYFANDVGYHMDKVNRNYDYLINILGADHAGYIKRITAAVSAISDNKINLDCKVCQLVKLFKNGKPFKMSKRAGEFISAKDLLDEVDKDAIRFMMLNRSNDVELDFDFDKILEKSKDNPVFYVQYSYARISSIFRKLDIKETDKIKIDNKKIELNKNETEILRKIFEWPKIIESASNKFEPHKLPYFLYELSTLFHSYWSKGNEDEKYKFIENHKIKRNEIFAVMNLIAIVLQNGMGILGVSLPDKM